jgi:hypothetical protein
MFNDAQSGITFEFGERAAAESRCVAIIAHPTDNLGDVYLVYKQEVDLIRRLATTDNVNTVLRGYGIDP